MRLRKILSIAGLSLAILLVSGVVYLGTADLGRHREWIEAIASHRIGRALSIEGEFHLRLGRVVRVSADRIRLANTAWGMRPNMLELDQMALRIDLWSLFSRPVRVRSLSVGAARLSLERDEQFQANWVLPRRHMFKQVPLIPNQVDAHHVVVTLHGPRIQRPVDIELDSVRVTEGQDRMLHLLAAGRLGEHEGTIKGTAGPVPSLVSGRNLRFDLESRGDLSTVKLNGSIASLKDLERPDIELTATGPEVESITSIFGLPTIARGPFNVAGTVTGQSGDLDLQLEADLGDLDAEVQLKVRDPRRSPKFDLEALARGPNMGGVADLLGLKGLPRQPFTLSGSIRHDISGTALENIQLAADSIHAHLDGRLGEPPDYSDTSLTLEATGPDLSTFGPALGVSKMGPARFQLAGRIGHARGGLVLESGQLKIAASVLQAQGRLGALPDLQGTDLKFSLAVPDLSSLGVVAGVDKLPSLPFDARFRTRFRDNAAQLQDIVATLGSARLGGNAVLSRHKERLESRFALTAEGPDLGILLQNVKNTPRPGIPFKVQTELATIGAQTSVQKLGATFGDTSVSVQGTVGAPPRFSGTDLYVQLGGGSLARSLRPFDLGRVPDESFELGGHVTGSSGRIVWEPAQARLGEHRGRGRMTFEPGDPGRVALRFDVDTLDLTPVVMAADEPGDKRQGNSQDEGLVIPDTPLPMKWPEGMLVDADITVGRLQMNRLNLVDFGLAAKLGAERLEIQPVKALMHGGQVNGALSVQRRHDGLQAELNLQARDIRLGVRSDTGVPVAQLPPADIEISLSGRGRSLHGMASTANGKIQLVYGKGLVANTTGAGLLFTSDILVQVLVTIIPFAKREPFTQLECGLAVAQAKDGLLTSEPVLLQTDKLLIASSGRLNLSDETLDVVFRTRVREGLGLSAAKMLNPYLKIGGTLASWELALDPKGAAIAGGAAAATGGLSILADALWGRLAGMADACGKELKRRGLRVPGSD